MTTTEYRVLRHHNHTTTTIAETTTRAAAEHHARRSRGVLPHVPVTIQARTTTTTYGPWEDTQ